jgi:transcriptional regulator of acetoin/glycerol metabolism
MSSLADCPWQMYFDKFKINGEVFVMTKKKKELAEKIEAIKSLQREIVVESLIAYDWNVVRAAKALGISRANLYRRIKQHGLSRRGQIESQEKIS